MIANSITTNAEDVITSALQEIGALAPGEIPANEDLAWGLKKLQRLIDRYNARRPLIYNVNFSTFTLQANHSPHTIGPGADFDVVQRPIEIPTIGLILIGSIGSQVEIPLTPRDQDWWAAQTIKSLTSTLPTDYYYSPDWPNGQIFFWPIPTAVNNVLVQSRLVLGEFKSYAQTFTLPPGYWDLITYELAITLAPSYERPVSQDLRDFFQKALKAVEGNNISSPRLASDSPSQSSTSRARPDFNFLNGLSQ